jgi:hypothetical protein
MRTRHRCVFGARTRVMHDVRSCCCRGLLVAWLVLVDLDFAALRVTWELVQPKLPPSPATRTANYTLQQQAPSSPWPVSTIEVHYFSSFLLAP